MHCEEEERSTKKMSLNLFDFVSVCVGLTIISFHDIIQCIQGKIKLQLILSI